MPRRNSILVLYFDLWKNFMPHGILRKALRHIYTSGYKAGYKMGCRTSQEQNKRTSGA